jgi:hypothetical protein
VLARLSHALTCAELTQAAHRNRPLRHPNRIVVTFSAADPDDLPVTRTIAAWPRNPPDAPRREWLAAREQARGARLAAAYASLQAEGRPVTLERLRQAACVNKQVAADWLRARRAADGQSQEGGAGKELVA